MTDKTLYLFRHGETDWNVEKRFQGRTSAIPLNQTGMAQAALIAEKLNGLSLKTIYSSPLLRAKQTAELVARQIQADIVYVDALQERSFGLLEGMSFAEILVRYPELEHILLHQKNSEFVSASGNDYGVETITNTQARIYTTICDTVKQTPDTLVAFSLHGSILYNFLAFILGHEDFPHIPNGEVIQVNYHASSGTFTLFNAEK